MADALQWIFNSCGIYPLLYYLDDDILVANSKDKVTSYRHIRIRTFELLIAPIKPSKLEGRSICLSFLGIKIDTDSLMFYLPSDKLDKLKSELSHCILRCSVTTQELQSLVGLLQFATKVIHPGETFLRSLYAMQDIGSHPDHHIWFNIATRTHILWWMEWHLHVGFE